MPESAWLVGSIFLTAFNIEVNGVNKAFGSGYYYLRHATAALSLIDALETALQTEAAGAEWYVTEDRTVRLQPLGGQPVAIDWLSSTNVRDLVGYAGNQASSDAAYDAPNVSPMLWSPGWLAIPETILGTAGYATNDHTTMVSADGTVALTDHFYSQVWQNLSWSHILVDRMRASGTGGGTFHELYEQFLKLGYSVRYYESISEADGSMTAVTWDDSSTNSFGAYRLRPGFSPRWYARAIASADIASPMELPLMQVDDYL